MRASVLSLVLFFIYQQSYSQFIQTNGPPGGTVSCLTISEGNLFAGTEDGVFISTDKGTSWNPAGLQSIYISALFGEGKNIYAGTFGKGIFLTTNNGVEWVEINNGIPYEASYGYIPVNDFITTHSFLFAATWAGLFTSSDNGQNWTKVTSGLPSDDYYSISFEKSGPNLLMGTTQGLFISSNDGLSWKKGESFEGAAVQDLAISGLKIFAGTGGGRGHTAFGSVFCSTDNGENWEKTRPPP